MNCRRADHLFSAAWEDELTVAEREALESHIESCTACRASYDGFVRVQEAVQGLPRLEAATDFSEAVWAKIRAAEAPSRPVFARKSSGGWLVASFRPALAAAAGLAVVFAVVAYVNRQPAPVSRNVEPMATLDKPAPAPVIASIAPSRTQTSPSVRLRREDRVAANDLKKEVAPAEVAGKASLDYDAPARAPMGIVDASGNVLEMSRGAIAATPNDTSGGLDSLFNHDYDVEFALDPVHLKRVPGQKRLTPARPAPTEEVGKRASVTF
jgi:hypothetical protein